MRVIELWETAPNGTWYRSYTTGEIQQDAAFVAGALNVEIETYDEAAIDDDDFGARIVKVVSDGEVEASIYFEATDSEALGIVNNVYKRLRSL